MLESSYEDDHLSIDNSGITIQNYYFPLSTRKVIPWEQLKSARSFELTFWTGKYRIWGMGTAPWWFNCDSDRPSKTIGFVLDTGSIIKPAITPDDPVRVREILSQRGLMK